MSKEISRNDLCWCGSSRKYKFCHADIETKIAFYKIQGHKVPTRKIIKTSEQIDGIRKSGKINIAVLDYVAQHMKAGITTEDIDQLVHHKTIELGGIPAPLGYEGFTKNSCTSVNNQVCHGVPSEKDILKDGDIINVDVSTIYNGYFSDSSRMFCIGNVSEENRLLVNVAKECIAKGLEMIRPWGFLGDMAQALHEHALKHGYSVVREIGGHGIGLEFHEEPWVSHVSQKGKEMLLVPGMIFTIEPMINQGTDKVFIDRENGWTVYTADGKPSAQWEVMILITDKGYEILAY